MTQPRYREHPSNAKGYIRTPNVYNAILDGERNLFAAIEQAGGLEALACPGATVYDKPPYLVMPPQGQQFQKQASIPLPGVGADTLVVQFRVPVGYDGVITSLVNFWTGAGFVEGSGDFAWRVQINRRWAKSYGNILTTLGSLTSPCQLFRGGIRIYSNELVSYFFQHVAGAEAGGRINCALMGYFYPCG